MSDFPNIRRKSIRDPAGPSEGDSESALFSLMSALRQWSVATGPSMVSLRLPRPVLQPRLPSAVIPANCQISRPFRTTLVILFSPGILRNDRCRSVAPPGSNSGYGYRTCYSFPRGRWSINSPPIYSYQS